MISQEILIPFGLPPAEHAKDLVKLLTSECGKDGLALLLSRYQSLAHKQFDNFSLQLPHEICLDARLTSQGYSLLQHYANSLNINLNPGHWFLFNPVHLHIARSHLVLTDYRQLVLSEHEARLLFEKAQVLCNEMGMELRFGSATTWFLRTSELADLMTASPDAACGHNIDIWLPTGPSEIIWRKLHNEIQMEWFAHPLQQQRESRGEKVINGVWLWSGTSLPMGFKAHQTELIVASPTAKNFFISPPALTLLDELSSAALSNDWATWATHMIELENAWFRPLYTALKEKKLTQLQLHLSNSNTLLSVKTNSNQWRKFWRAPTFNNLII